ncbi:MAG: hypothetical protein WC366_02890 [Bacilli bacterium]|jgi:hypothetical protein
MNWIEEIIRISEISPIEGQTNYVPADGNQAMSDLQIGIIVGVLFSIIAIVILIIAIMSIRKKHRQRIEHSGD